MKWIISLGLRLIPGGQVAAILSTIADICLSVLGWCLAFVKWLVVDITDAFKEPQRLAVRVICLLAVLIGGLWGGIVHKARKDAVVIQKIMKERDEARAELAQWRERHAEQERRAEAAEQARKDAEARVVPAPAVAAPVRLRARPAAAASQGFGSGVFKNLFANP